jgi:hypothetical protein
MGRYGIRVRKKTSAGPNASMKWKAIEVALIFNEPLLRPLKNKLKTS